MVVMLTLYKHTPYSPLDRGETRIIDSPLKRVVGGVLLKNILQKLKQLLRYLEIYSIILQTEMRAFTLR